MDRRQRKTRQAVFLAFAELLEKRSYSKISVQDIIDTADIGRSTFYSHFETKDDLLKALCEEIFQHVFSPHTESESTHDFTLKDQNIENAITHILYHLKDSEIYIRSILSSDSCDVFMRFFKEKLAHVFGGEIDKYDSDIPNDYMLNHLVSDFAENVRWWMNHDEYSPEEISRFFFSTTPF